MSLLANYISTLPPPATTTTTPHNENAKLSHEYAIADFLDVLPKLNAGMHVNVRFDSPTSFEFTRELSVFDVFPSVRLVHGWLVDPQDVRLTVALSHLSYNQVCDQLVRTAEPFTPDGLHDAMSSIPHSLEPSAPPPEAFATLENASTEGDDEATSSTPPAESAETATIREVRPAVVDFLESNATQLTVYGLTELHAVLREGETSILFRNCHFYVLRKFRGEVFTLVTDEGYLNELNTVWEKLVDVSGDSVFYNGAFCPLSPTGLVLDRADGSRTNGPSAAAATSAATATATATATANATAGGQSPRSELQGRKKPSKGGGASRTGGGGQAGGGSGSMPSDQQARKKKSGKNVCVMQ